MSGAGNRLNISVGGSDRIVSGEVVGQTLVLRRSTGGTVNINMPSGGVDFDALTALQREALIENVRGDRALDLAGNNLGFYVA